MVLLVCVELCTLSFRMDEPSKADIVATALFGDGAAACVLRAGEGGFAEVAGDAAHEVEGDVRAEEQEASEVGGAEDGLLLDVTDVSYPGDEAEAPAGARPAEPRPRFHWGARRSPWSNALQPS